MMLIIGAASHPSDEKEGEREREKRELERLISIIAMRIQHDEVSSSSSRIQRDEEGEDEEEDAIPPKPINMYATDLVSVAATRSGQNIIAQHLRERGCVT